MLGVPPRAGPVLGVTRVTVGAVPLLPEPLAAWAMPSMLKVEMITAAALSTENSGMPTFDIRCAGLLNFISECLHAGFNGATSVAGPAVPETSRPGDGNGVNWQPAQGASAAFRPSAGWSLSRSNELGLAWGRLVQTARVGWIAPTA